MKEKRSWSRFTDADKALLKACFDNQSPTKKTIAAFDATVGKMLGREPQAVKSLRQRLGLVSFKFGERRKNEHSNDTQIDMDFSPDQDFEEAMSEPLPGAYPLTSPTDSSVSVIRMPENSGWVETNESDHDKVLAFVKDYKNLSNSDRALALEFLKFIESE